MGYPSVARQLEYPVTYFTQPYQNPSIFIGAEFGSLTILAISNEKPKYAICACSQFGVVGTALITNLLRGTTTSGKNFKTFRLPQGTIVDDDILVALRQENSRWGLHKKGYIHSYCMLNGEQKQIRLHNKIWIMKYGEIPHGMIIDHINGNKLDNRLSNLRLATPQQNTFNQRRRRSNQSGFKGVCFHKCTGKWIASIGYGGQKLHLGLFSTPEEAAAVVATKRQELHGEFARHD